MRGSVTVSTRADLEQLLSSVAHHLASRLSTVLAEHGSTLEEWRVLSLLGISDGQSMSRIAAYSMLPAPTLTKLVDRMVAANLVHRRGDEEDRRRVLIHLTARGRATLVRLQQPVRAEQARHDEVIAEVVDPTSLTTMLSDVLDLLD